MSARLRCACSSETCLEISTGDRSSAMNWWSGCSPARLSTWKWWPRSRECRLMWRRRNWIWVMAVGTRCVTPFFLSYGTLLSSLSFSSWTRHPTPAEQLQHWQAPVQRATINWNLCGLLGSFVLTKEGYPANYLLCRRGGVDIKRPFAPKLDWSTIDPMTPVFSRHDTTVEVTIDAKTIICFSPGREDAGCVRAPDSRRVLRQSVALCAHWRVGWSLEDLHSRAASNRIGASKAHSVRVWQVWRVSYQTEMGVVLSLHGCCCLLLSQWYILNSVMSLCVGILVFATQLVWAVYRCKWHLYLENSLIFWNHFIL